MLTEMDLATIVLIWGVTAISGALFGAIIAAMKNRSADNWGFSCFIFPPALLILLLLPKGTYNQRRKKISQNDLDEDIKDEWF
ncbi:MAG: hypothetical protein ACRBBN_01640 [Methyloligellaceae bacterium]